jgi:5-methylcytosine-specific restriction endonuclease McrA
MTYKPCPRCKRLIPAGLTYCPECKPIADAEWEAAKEHNAKLRQRRYNRGRDRSSEITRFRRSKPWKDTSKSKLQSCGYKCEAGLDGCGRIACEVHHIKPLKTPEGWKRRLDWSNLMGVCVQCHNKLDNKTFNKYNDEGVIDLRTVER